MIVVTGASGFIGSALVRYLNDAGEHDLILVDDFKTSHRWKNLLGKKFKLFQHKDEFLDLVKKEAFPYSIKAIVHLGACSSTTERDVDFLYRNNFLYTKILAEFSIKNNIRFIYASSAATYGDGSLGYDDRHEIIPSLKPLNAYGFSKQLFDMWAFENNHLNSICGLKFFNVYGPNEYEKQEMQSVVLKAFQQIQQHGSVKLFKSYKNEYKDGEQKRDFLYVRDACELMLWLLSNPKHNGIFNVGSGKAESWNQLVHGVFAALNRPPKIEYIEMPESLRGQYQYFTEAPMEKIKNAGYRKPFLNITEGAKDYVQNFLSMGLKSL